MLAWCRLVNLLLIEPERALRPRAAMRGIRDGEARGTGRRDRAGVGSFARPGATHDAAKCTRSNGMDRRRGDGGDDCLRLNQRTAVDEVEHDERGRHHYRNLRTGDEPTPDPWYQLYFHP